MNTEYTYMDGKIYVMNSNGKVIEHKYHDRIDEILKQENIVEELENNINYLKQEKERFEYKKKDLLSLIFTNGNYFNCFTVSFLICVISSFAEIYTVTEFGKNIISIILHFTGLISGIALIPTALIQIRKNKKLFNKNLNITKQQIDEFELELEAEKEKLTVLNNSKTNNNTKKNIAVEIDNNENKTIQEIRRKIQFYEELKEQINSRCDKQKVISRNIKN